MADTPAEIPRLGTVQAYARLARLQAPVGFLLLMWPCWWAVALAGPPAWQTVRLVVLFCIGAIVMRAAGCVWNDIVDKDFDARVARTRHRPIASGRISVRQGLVFMGLLALVGLAVLLSMGQTAIFVGIASLCLILPYPFMKRITWWPQAWLGITFNWGALVGWAAATGGLGAPALVMYAAGIAWTLGYDTIYAHQDKEDDALVGLKSSARRLGAKTRPALWAFYGLAMAGFLAAGILAGLGWLFLVLGLLAGGQLAWQVWRLDFDDPADCLAKFQSSNVFGWSFLAAIVASQVAG
jgi:4-hydroxybenzoate polyprenyltransferase